MEFAAKLELGGKTATGIEVPPEVVEALGGGKRPAVTVTLDGYTYPSTIGVMGGRSLIPVSAEIRAAAGVAAGDDVMVVLELDTAPRVVEIPPDVAAAFAEAPAARAAYEKLSFSNQKRWILSVTDAKTPETRTRRITKLVTDLSPS